MSIEIRAAGPDDYEGVVEALSTSFLERPDVPAVARQVRDVWEGTRTWIAVDGADVVGTFRSWPTELTLPGLGRLPAGAVSGVTVMPTHRRRGVLRRMAEADHAGMAERGEAVALLYASEFPIYGRFGYGNATRWATLTVDTTRTGIVAGEGTGVRVVTPDARVRDEIRDLYDAYRRAAPGELRRRDVGWDFRLGLAEDAWDGRWKGWLAVHRDATGALDGYLRYTAEHHWENHVAKIAVTAQELIATTEEAERALWAHLVGMDLVASIRAQNRPVYDRLGYRLTNPRAITTSDIGDALWVRLLDVPRALAARGYEREGSLVLEVVDERAAGGRLRLALDASPDGASCAATGRSADLTLPVGALGSVYLGAHDLRDVAIRAGVDEHRPGALAEAAALFRTLREPWCSTFF